MPVRGAKADEKHAEAETDASRQDEQTRPMSIEDRTDLYAAEKR